MRNMKLLKLSLVFLIAIAGSNFARALSPSQLDRATTLRAALLDTLEQAYANDGHWPDHPTPLAVDWTYHQPPPPPADPSDRGIIAGVTIAVQESTTDHPDGIWLGYADGHLEFVADAHTLADAQSQQPLAQRAIHTYHSKVDEHELPPPAESLLLHLVDADNHPVVGGTAGAWGHFGDHFPNTAGFKFSNGDGYFPPLAPSDPQGNLKIPSDHLFVAKFSEQQSEPIWIRQKNRNLMACIDITRAQLTASAGKFIAVQMQPMCHVNGRVTTLGLAKLGRTYKRTLALCARAGQLRMYTLTSDFNGDRFQFDLPPGDWELNVYGTDSVAVHRYIHLTADHPELNLVLDLPTEEAVTRFGQPALELQKIKAWKNTVPLTLADLRGKVVLLDFWGYWCGPCVGGMPALIKLHDEFKDKGLVIIAIHDDSAETMAEIDEKCRPAKAEYWNNRDLPFPIALDGGGRTRIHHSASTTAGATTAAYGVKSFPSTFLIDQSGNLIEQVHPSDPELHDKIARMLATSH